MSTQLTKISDKLRTARANIEEGKMIAVREAKDQTPQSARLAAAMLKIAVRELHEIEAMLLGETK